MPTNTRSFAPRNVALILTQSSTRCCEATLFKRAKRAVKRHRMRALFRHWKRSTHWATTEKSNRANALRVFRATNANDKSRARDAANDFARRPCQLSSEPQTPRARLGLSWKRLHHDDKRAPAAKRVESVVPGQKPWRTGASLIVEYG